MDTLQLPRLRRLFWIAAIALVAAAGTAFAQDEVDPPARVAYLSARAGSVVFAPDGEDEWIELPQNRPLTSGDRMWTDRGARAELQLGAATLHVAGESHLGVGELDDLRARFVVQQGTVNVRVRELEAGENVEIDTPNLALRALQPGDYRIDVDPRSGATRVTVASGTAMVFGEGGESLQLGAGQQASFAGRALAQVQAPQFLQDDFGLWAAERNRLEDQSIAARYVPRGVVGYAQLDQHGSWGQDPGHGAVWYPRLAVQDWAPYRYGHWEWVSPWGWTWIDDAPWGFAPFHYGRWTMIGSRWAWVPGRLVARPVYSPALVVFLGGGGTRIALGSGPAFGWYPLAPGEVWWPVYRTSPRYVQYANRHYDLNAWPRHRHDRHVWRNRPLAVTAVPEDDFRRGRPVYRHWQPLPAQVIGQARVGAVPVRPERHRGEPRHAPRLHAEPPAAVQPAIAPGIWGNRDGQRSFGGREAPPAVRDENRALREQDRLQRAAERAAREQQRAQEQARQQQDVQQQREQMLRQQQEQAGKIRIFREAAQRQQQQEQAARHEQERAQREAWRQQREQQREQQKERPANVLVQPQQVQPVQQPQQASPLRPAPQQQAAPIGRERGERGERRERGERGGQRDDGQPGEGQGQRRGPWQRGG